MSFRVLVFPCGSETGLEIHRALRYSTHFMLFGGSSIEDHGSYIYENYIGDIPFYDNDDFEESIITLIKKHDLHAIYPTMDSVIEKLQLIAPKLGIKIIGSSFHASSICASKQRTYEELASTIPVPECYSSPKTAHSYPIFIKPDRGYGSRLTALAQDEQSAWKHIERHNKQKMLMLEYLPGKEWTIDCFSDRTGQLRFSSARWRSRVSNGISVNTTISKKYTEYFSAWAHLINERLQLRGAWFFQAKQDKTGQPKLLEVGARFAGSSAIQRALGVNLPLLSLFDAFEFPIEISKNNYEIEMDRALENKFKIEIKYNDIYVDLDDCILINNKINTQLIAFLYESIEKKQKITLVTRHKGNLEKTLREKRIEKLFDEIIHIDQKAPKSKYITINPGGAIFIDDSHKERHEVAQTLGIPVFSPDMIEALK